MEEEREKEREREKYAAAQCEDIERGNMDYQ